MPLDMAQMRLQFNAESMALLDNIEAAALRIEKKPDGGEVDEIFRAIHTIKGNSAVFKLNSLTAFAHDLETALSHYRNAGTQMLPAAIDAILVLTDILRRYFAAEPGSEPAYPDAEIRGLIAKIESDESTPAHAEPAPAGKPAKRKNFKIPEPLLEKARAMRQWLYLLQIDLAGETEFIDEAFLGKLGSLTRLGKPVYRRLVGETGAKSGNAALLLVVLVCPQPMDVTAGREWKKLTIHELFAPAASPFTTAAAKPAAAPAAIKEVLKSESTLRIPLKLLDEIINLAGEAVIARNDLIHYIGIIKDRRLEVIGKHISGLLTELQGKIMRTRLQPLQSVFDRLPRICRDTASLTGKKVDLTVNGGEVELDKSLIEALIDPLMHIIRNAVDHGIESPDARIQAGKNATGKIEIRSFLHLGRVAITIGDDGRGFDKNAIRNAARKKGLASPDEIQTMDDTQLLDFVFHPGFSTSATVSETSGRGVGMDVVRRNLRDIGGTVNISTETGNGSAVVITLPQTLSIITALLVAVRGETYAIQQDNVREVIKLNPDARHTANKDGVVDIRGEFITVLDLGKALGVAPSASQPEYLVVTRTDRYEFGLLVSDITGAEEIVIKPLDEKLQNLGIYAGATILGSGESILILDIPGFAGQLKIQPQRQKVKQIVQNTAEKISVFVFRIFSQFCAVSMTAKPKILRSANASVGFAGGKKYLKSGETVIPVLPLHHYLGIPEIPGETGKYILLFNISGRVLAVETDYLHGITEIAAPRLPRREQKVRFTEANIDGEIGFFIDAESFEYAEKKEESRTVTQVA